MRCRGAEVEFGQPLLDVGGAPLAIELQTGLEGAPLSCMNASWPVGTTLGAARFEGAVLVERMVAGKQEVGHASQGVDIVAHCRGGALEYLTAGVQWCSDCRRVRTVEFADQGTAAQLMRCAEIEHPHFSRLGNENIAGV